MACEIADVWQTYDDTNTAVPIVGEEIRAKLFANLAAFTDATMESPASERIATTGTDGTWSITLPAGSTMDPAGTKYMLVFPDGTAWAGVVPEVAGPLSVKDLKDAYLWTQVQPR